MSRYVITTKPCKLWSIRTHSAISECICVYYDSVVISCMNRLCVVLWAPIYWSCKVNSCLPDIGGLLLLQLNRWVDVKNSNSNESRGVFELDCSQLCCSIKQKGNVLQREILRVKQDGLSSSDNATFTYLMFIIKISFCLEVYIIFQDYLFVQLDRFIVPVQAI